MTRLITKAMKKSLLKDNAKERINKVVKEANKKTEEVRAKDYSEKGAVLLKKSILRNKEK